MALYTILTSVPDRNNIDMNIEKRGNYLGTVLYGGILLRC